MRLFIFFIIVLTAFVSCGDDKGNTNETDKCKDVTCDEWKQCNALNGNCETKENRCSNNGECSGSQICDDNHNCVNPDNPCEGQSCSNLGVCITENNIAKCNCNEGYIAAGLTCVEIIVNLCENVTCDEWKSCNITNGNCELNAGRCALNSDCTDGKECDVNHNCVTPINPCEGQSCSNFGVCITENNIAKCNCNDGYIAEGLTCVDINECDSEIDNCETGFTCENTIGSFNCNDMDECDLNTHNCENGFYCVNTNGSFECADVNECNTSDICGDGYICENIVGSFSCIDIDECSIASSCDINATCTNTVGSYECKCKSGFSGNGYNCYINPFLTTWKTDNAGVSSSTQITIPTNPTYTYNYDVDCNYNGADFNPTATDVTTSYTCEYDVAGEYQVAIIGDFPSIYFNNTGDRLKILSINNWGSIHWLGMNLAFAGCSNLTLTVTDSPDLSNVTDMSFMFYGATHFNGDLSGWDVSNVTGMRSMFQGATSFNGDLSGWDVSNIINMASMFYNTTSFNCDISSWNVSNIIDMSYMFFIATSFNQDLSGWDVSNVTNMNWMFYHALSFNQPLNSWNVSNVRTMSQMFRSAISFNQDLSSWDVDQVTTCGYVYTNTSAWTLPKPNFTSCTP